MLPPAALLPPLQSSSVQILEHFKLSVMQILRKSECYIKQHKVCLRKPAFWSLNSVVPGDCCGRFCLGLAIPGQLDCLNVAGADALQSLQSSKKRAKGLSLVLLRLRAAITDCIGLIHENEGRRVYPSFCAGACRTKDFTVRIAAVRVQAIGSWCGLRRWWCSLFILPAVKPG